MPGKRELSPSVEGGAALAGEFLGLLWMFHVPGARLAA